MKTHFLNEDQNEALVEVYNLGMGRAGAALGELLDTFVTLTMPETELVEASQLAEIIEKRIKSSQPVSAVRQAFYSDLRGEVCVIFEIESCRKLAQLMGYDADEPGIEQELLLDITNIIAGACLSSVAEQLEEEFSFSPPSIMDENVSLEELFSHYTLPWKHALLSRVRLELKQHAFTNTMLVFLSDDSIDKLRAALDRFIESFG